jgi:hypothetical protein
MAGGAVGKVKETLGWDNATKVGKVLMFFGVLFFLGIGITAIV